jgi:signal transduction histidine kinase
MEYNREKDLIIDINDIKTNIKPELLSFILSELVDNALKNSIEGTPIKISVECKDGYNVFKVTDYGTGINTSKIENMSSFTLQNFSQKNTYGLGLSLTIIKKIVKLYNVILILRARRIRRLQLKLTSLLSYYNNSKAV